MSCFLSMQLEKQSDINLLCLSYCLMSDVVKKVPVPIRKANNLMLSLPYGKVGK